MSAARATSLLLMLGLACCVAQAGERTQLLLDDGWMFAFASDMSDADAFTPVQLPHTWNGTDTANKSVPYRRDVGVYRRDLPVDESLAGRVLYLWFEGANQVTEVSINGQAAGRHVGGYTGFALDITDLVEIGRSNRIEVRVDNRHDNTVPPLNADFTFYGGLYRDVWLLALDPVHVAIDEYGASALDIRTKSLLPSQASLELAAGLRNTRDEAVEIRISARIVDARGREVARSSNQARVPAGMVIDHTLGGLVVEDPALWSPEMPQLYRVICRIERDGDTLDVLERPLGLRQFAVDPDKGFLLNGRPYRLIGTNRHQDYEGLGNAMPNELQRADLEHVKADGFNFLRLAHYPQDPAVLAAADELGLIVWEEIPVVNIIGLSEEFGDNAERMLREMIRQHRGHASIAFWGYMNEVTLTLPEPLPEGYYDSVVRLAGRLEQVVEAEDPTRYTVMALSRDELARSPPALQSITDVLAFNLYFGWYYEDFAALGRFLDDYHAQHPERPLMVSEYGAGSDRRVHAREPRAFDFSIEYQQAFHEAAFAQILERPWLAGSAVWNQFDFGSSHRQDTMYGINQKGLWTFDRTPKDVAWYYRAMLSSTPVVHIAARDWTLRAGSRTEDAVMPVKVYSNAKRVSLSANGDSLGTRDIVNGSATWPVRFLPGANRLDAIGAGTGDSVEVTYVDRSGLFDGTNGGLHIAVNAGGQEQVVDGNTVFEADREYAPGGWGHVGGEAESTHHRIFATNLDPLYQSRRRGRFDYRFDVPDGPWCATLHEAGYETFESSISRRQMQAAGDHGLELHFGQSGDEAFVNAIELDPGECPATR